MSIIILGLLLYRMIPAECHFWEFVGRSSLQSNWKLSTADIQHQFIVNHSKSLNKPYRDKHDKVTNTINIYQHGSASNGVILMGHNMGHREEDVSIVGEQGSCGSFALRRYRWNSWPKAPKSVPFVTICVVATEVWFTKALPSFSCFIHVSPLFGILWSGATKCLYIRFMLANIIIHCQCAVRPLKYPKTEIWTRN